MFNGIEGKISSTETFINESKYNTDKQNLEKKMSIFIKQIPYATDLVKTTDNDIKIREIN